MDKKINYLARTFEDYRSELINLSNKYYPEMSTNYNDSSVSHTSASSAVSSAAYVLFYRRKNW